MGAFPSPSVVSLDEYLANPKYEHFEWVDGEVMDHHAGTFEHGEIQGIYWALIRDYLGTNRSGRASIERHCRLRIGGRIRFRLPDDRYVSTARNTQSRYLEGARDLAIEIRLAADSVHDLLQWAEEYFTNGRRCAGSS